MELGGRFNTCRFVRRFPDAPHLAEEIRCGVAAMVLKTMVSDSFDLISHGDAAQAQAILDGSFHITNFVLDAEQLIGMFVDDGQRRFWSGNFRGVGSVILRLRDHLNRAASLAKADEVLGRATPVLLVEGESEARFLDRLSLSPLAAIRELDVQVYGGRDRRGTRQMGLLVDQLTRKGYVVYLQGDKDGNSSDNASHLENRVPGDRRFMFDWDFETAVPANLLFAALRRLGQLQDVALDCFEQVVEASNGRVSDTLQREFRIDLQPLKSGLASEIADIIVRSGVAWWGEEELMDLGELGMFVRFVLDIR